MALLSGDNFATMAHRHAKKSLKINNQAAYLQMREKLNEVEMQSHDVYKTLEDKLSDNTFLATAMKKSGADADASATTSAESTEKKDEGAAATNETKTEDINPEQSIIAGDLCRGCGSPAYRRK